LKQEEDRLKNEACILMMLGEFLIDLRPDIEFCPICGKRLLVLKTDKKWFAYLDYGMFRGRSIYLYCEDDKYLPLQPDERVRLRKYVPCLPCHNRGKSPYSMDVVCFVGKSKFIKNRDRDYIREELRHRFGIKASDGTITNLSIEFIVRFYLYHQIHFDCLASEIKSGVGYILGTDGTGDGNSDRIILFMDLLRNWVLKSIDVPSEGSEYVKPYLEEIIGKLNDPIVGVSDASSGFHNAHMDVIPHVPHRDCSFHVLQTIGCALFKEDHSSLSALLKEQPCTVASLRRLRKKMKRKSETDNIPIREYAMDGRKMTNLVHIPIDDMIFSQTYDVISWILRYHEDNNKMDFPFSLPRLNFYNRCTRGIIAVREIIRTATNTNRNPKLLHKLYRQLTQTVEGTGECTIKIRYLAKELNSKLEYFNELREILDIPNNIGDIPRDQLVIKNNERVQEMKQNLIEYERNMKELTKRGNDGAQIICDYIEKYRESLIMDNIIVEVNGEEVLVEIPRTNGLLELCFGGVKGDIRKRTGKKDTSRVLKIYNKYLGYIRNIKSETYIELMFGSEDRIPEALAEIPIEIVDKEMKQFHEAAIGYDITNNGHRDDSISFEELMEGIRYVHENVEKSMILYRFHPPDDYGMVSWGRYYFQDLDHFSSKIPSENVPTDS